MVKYILIPEDKHATTNLDIYGLERHRNTYNTVTVHSLTMFVHIILLNGVG